MHLERYIGLFSCIQINWNTSKWISFGKRFDYTFHVHSHTTSHFIQSAFNNFLKVHQMSLFSDTPTHCVDTTGRKCHTLHEASFTHDYLQAKFRWKVTTGRIRNMSVKMLRQWRQAKNKNSLSSFPSLLDTYPANNNLQQESFRRLRPLTHTMETATERKNNNSNTKKKTQSNNKTGLWHWPAPV